MRSRLEANNMCAHSGYPTLRLRGADHCSEGLAARMQIAARARRRAGASVTPACVEHASRAPLATCRHRAREWRAARVARATCSRLLRARRGKCERAQWRSLLRETRRTTLTRTRARYANVVASRTLSQSARRILAPRALSLTSCGAGDDASELAALTSDRGAL